MRRIRRPSTTQAAAASLSARPMPFFLASHCVAALCRPFHAALGGAERQTGDPAAVEIGMLWCAPHSNSHYLQAVDLLGEVGAAPTLRSVHLPMGYFTFLGETE